MQKNNLNKVNQVNINKSSAFSLIEMSIAIILIALIVVGIVGGSRIIKNAKISGVISEMSNYSTDTNAFYDRFEQYPGDFNMANSMFVDDDNDINDGDNNGLIGNIDFSEDESAGFFHHLRLAGIILTIPFTGVAVANAENVIIDENYPGTRFSNDTFYYVASDSVDGKYKKNNRIIIASTAGSDIGSLTPQDAESLDNKIDDRKPLTGKVIAHNMDTAKNTNGCVVGGVGEFDYIETIPEAVYNTNSSGKECILKKSLDGSEEIIAAPSCGAACPTVDDDGNIYDPCVLANLPDTVNSKYIVDWIGNIAHESIARGDCDSSYYSSGTATGTCNDGTWGSFTENCVDLPTCTVPALDATGFEKIIIWIDTATEEEVAMESEIFEGVTIAGTCEDESAGFPETTCTTSPDVDPLTEEEKCSATGCTSDVCTGFPSYYCGDNWNCTDGTCCNNTINVSSPGTVFGDCLQNCTNANFGDDTITNASLDAYGDCGFTCSGAMGNDIINNTTRTAYGDCNDCSGTMGNDIITNTGSWANGDCASGCSGTMGNDILINTGGYARGDCGASCSGVTQWATDIFRYTVSNTSEIADFNAGGVDDKIELPSGATVSVTGSEYSRTLTYSGSTSGILTISCNPSENDCDTGGAWDVNACNIYIGGAQQSSCTGCGTGSCNFN
jgi:hypothetical protein